MASTVYANSMANSGGNGPTNFPFGLTQGTNTVTAGTYTVQASDRVIRCNAAAGPITVQLLGASASLGVELIIKKVDSTANAVTILAAGSDLIDGQSSLTISQQYVSVTIQGGAALAWDITG